MKEHMNPAAGIPHILFFVGTETYRTHALYIRLRYHPFGRPGHALLIRFPICASWCLLLSILFWLCANLTSLGGGSRAAQEW